MKSHAARSALLAFAAALFVAVIVPLQTYLGNRTDYAFGLGRLLAECLALALAAGAVAFPLLWLSERHLRGSLFDVRRSDAVEGPRGEVLRVRDWENPQSGR